MPRFNVDVVSKIELYGAARKIKNIVGQLYSAYAIPCFVTVKKVADEAKKDKKAAPKIRKGKAKGLD